MCEQCLGQDISFRIKSDQYWTIIRNLESNLMVFAVIKSHHYYVLVKYIVLQESRAVLLQGESRDAAVNLEMYRILQQCRTVRAVSRPQHGFLAGVSADCSESYVRK